MARTKGAKNKPKEPKPPGEVEDPAAAPVKRPRGRPPLYKNQTITIAGIRHYEQNTMHEYTELAKTSLSNTGLYSLYGVVVDATSPHILQKDGKW